MSHTDSALSEKMMGIRNAALDSISHGVLIADSDETLVYVNDAFLRLSGYERSEVIGQNCRMLQGPLTDAGTIGEMRAAIDAAIEFRGEVLNYRKDGSVFWTALSISPVRDQVGSTTYFIGSLVDVSERVRNEQALRQSEQRLQLALEAGQTGLWEWDIAAQRSIWNAQMYDLLGMPRSDETVPTDLFFQRVHPDDVVGLQGELSRLLEEPIKSSTSDWRSEFRVVLADGRTRWLAGQGRLYRNVLGAAERMIGINHDVTEQRASIAELQDHRSRLQQMVDVLQAAIAEADRANLAKSDFLSSMSHELRSPLNAILGFAQLMDSESPPLAPGHKESAAQIIKAGWYLLELINEILDLAAIESGKVSLSLEPLSLDELMQDCQLMIEPQAHKAGIQVRFTQRETPLFVMGDRTRVKQVFVNLLSNAIKYTRAGGSVDVTYSACPGYRVRVSFRDTGDGLGPDKLAQLFQPFNRLGQETGLEEGTGIGLVVSKQLIEFMGGAIGVQSTVGVGSVFWIELATAPAFELQLDKIDHTPAAADDGAQQRTVLCIEDNAANLLLVSKLLARRSDIRLLTAMDATQGIAIANMALPDVILMDINLPGISGIKAFGVLAGNPLTARIPVVAISANAIPRDIEKGLAAGFFRYLTKPINVSQFMETLDLALERARTWTPSEVQRP